MRERCAKLVLFVVVGVLSGSVTHARAATVRKSSKAGRGSASAVLRSLSLHDRIAQLIIVREYGDYPRADDPEYKAFLRLVREDRVGGFIVANRLHDGSVVNAEPFEMAAFINHMQREARTPLLVASDFERGASMRVAETAKFPYLMAFGAAHDFAATRGLGAATAREARALGVTWVFAPDADVNNNPDNPIINTRSYGGDPQTVADGVSAFIEGAHSDERNYVLVTAKHFPGHGDTAEDSHIQLAVLDQPKERIESLELVPFRAAIAHGVDAVMSAHMAVSAFEPEHVPATVSRNILTGLLRDELGFKGLIVTDAMDMQGVTSLFSQGEAAARAIEAGADVILMPSDVEGAIRGIMRAVETGRISRARIDASVLKVLAAKQRVGLFQSRVVSLDELSDVIKNPQFDEHAQTVADAAVTLLKDDHHLFPMPEGGDSCLVVMTEGPFSTRGQALAKRLESRDPELTMYLVNPTTPESILGAIADDAAECDRIYVAAFIAVSAYRGNVSLAPELNSFMRDLVDTHVPLALVSLGNPYLARDFPDVKSYATTFSTTATSEIAAARAIVGEISITGKTPVLIPGVANVGDGLYVPAKGKTASNP